MPKKVKEVPDIAPCVGRRVRKGAYYAREVMSNHLGRKLLSTEHVHHINGDKADDRIENLSIVTISEHRSIHNKHAVVLELTCEHCGDTFKRKDWMCKKSKRFFCGRECFFAASVRRSMTPSEYNRYFYVRSKRYNPKRHTPIGP